jgi:hypothetical protein
MSRLMPHLKVYALVPAERVKACSHPFLAYHGRVPNTGPRVCSMCGATEDEIQESALLNLELN